MPVPYNLTLIALTILALAVLNGQALWCAAWLLAESLLLASFEGGMLPGDDRVWAYNATADFCAAALVLCVPISRGKIAVASFFAAMMVAHSIYAGVGPSKATTAFYLSMLSALSWLQAGAMAVWIGHDAMEDWNRVVAHWRSAFHAAAAFRRNRSAS